MIRLSIKPEGEPSYLVSYTRDEVSVGRRSDNDLTLDGDGVSGQHCLIRKTSRAYELCDLDSTNGTYVNDIKVDSPVAISSRDTVNVAGFVLKLVGVWAEEDHAAPGPTEPLEESPPAEIDAGTPKSSVLEDSTDEWSSERLPMGPRDRRRFRPVEQPKELRSPLPRKFRKIVKMVDERAIAWDERYEASLLLSDSELVEAEAWLVRADQYQPAPTQLHRNFVRASRRALRSASHSRLWKIGGVVISVVLGLSVGYLAVYRPWQARSASGIDVATLVRWAYQSIRTEVAFARADNQAHAAMALVDHNPRDAITLGVKAVESISWHPKGVHTLAAQSLRTLLGKTRGRTFGGHTKPIIGVASSADGSRMFSADRGGWQSRLYTQSNAPQQIPSSGDELTHVAISPKGKWLIVGGQGEARAWDLEAKSFASRSYPLEMKGSVMRTAFAQDGRRVLLASDADEVFLWNLEPQAEQLQVKKVPGVASDVSAIALAQDGSRIFVAAGDGEIQRWRVGASIVPMSSLEGHESRVEALSTCERWLVSGDNSGAAFLWSVSRKVKKPIHTLMPHDGVVRTFLSSPDCTVAVSVDESQQLHVWNLSRATTPPSPRSYPGTEEVVAVAMSASGRHVAYSSSDRAIRVLSDGTDSFAMVGSHTGTADHLAFSEDGRRLVTGAPDGQVRVWDPRSSYQGAQSILLYGHEGPLTGLAISYDSRFVVTTSADTQVGVWEIDDERQVGAATWLRGHKDDITTVSIEPNGRWVATGSRDRSVRAWDLQARSADYVQRLGDHEKDVTGVTYSPDGKWLVSVGNDKQVKVRSTSALDSPPVELHGHQGEILAVAISSDSTQLFTAGTDRVIYAWSLVGGSEGLPTSALHRFTGSSGTIRVLSVGPRGRWLASAAEGDDPRLWDLHTQQGYTLKGYEGAALSLAFSPDGTKLAAAGEDDKIHVWSIKSESTPPYERLMPLEGYKSNVTKLQFLHEGELLVTGDSAGRVRIWHLTGGKAFSEPVLHGHQKAISALEVSPDESFVVTGSLDGTARIWPIDPMWLAQIGRQVTGAGSE